MNVCGIDVSTHAVDIVKVPLDDGPPHWDRFPLVHPGDAFDRTRQVPLVVPGPAHSYWDDVIAVGMEEPAGRNPGYAFRVQGAVLSCVPRDKLVEKLMPSEWRKAVGLKGNASKEDVRMFALAAVRDFAGVDWRAASHDCTDAYCIALATRSRLVIGDAA